MIKPKCRYTGKPCPEKPFYVRESYPYGQIIERDKDGCLHWWIESMVKNEGTKDETIVQLGNCIDIFNIMYLKDYGGRALGNQQATESFRNAMCEEFFYTDNTGIERKKYVPKSDPNLIPLIEILSNNQNIISEFVLKIDEARRNKIDEAREKQLRETEIKQLTKE